MQVVTKMKLLPGYIQEYKIRHDNIWPELQQLLLSTGIEDYNIYLDEDTLTLFSVLTIEDKTCLESLPLSPIMKRWWHYMKDIMETNADESPVSIPLKHMFSL